ncbi:T9SS type A sorting domain-containing protein [Sporocytophaga myxococcoides]|uniref:T9SS type A sorting domain-containing protein n=1 Tax=Sporocytophaga myxococcoides TaxID=153721 RepID=UPI00042A010C|nr:T9SS type A sorting domain-containing protein [Sporocytophaga myxococcoides]
MKKQLLFISSLFLSLTLSAQKQLPNPSFEEWQNTGAEVEEPLSWLAPSDCEEGCEYYYEKVQDGHTGLAIKLKAVESDPDDVQPLMLIEEDFLAKPLKVTFWYKSSTEIRCAIAMSAGPIFSEEEIAVGEGLITAPPSGTFVKAEVPILYSEDKAPEHLLLVFALARGGLTSTDFVIIDDVELSYGLTSISNPLMTEVVGSNMISDRLELKSVVDEVQIFNSSGMLVLKATKSTVIDTSVLSEGLYMVSLKKGESFGTIKVLKK